MNCHPERSATTSCAVEGPCGCWRCHGPVSPFRRVQRITSDILMLPFLLFLPTSLSAQKKSYDGDWWRKRTSPEQEGFILGYGDCYADAAGQKVSVNIVNANMRIAVAVSYQGHENQRTQHVAQVLEDIWVAHIYVYDAQHAVAGEGWRERHGSFDGLWWKGPGA